MRYLIRYFLFSLLTICLSVNASIQQREQFVRAYDALQHNNIKDFKKLSHGLRNYPLFHYLRYQYLKPRLQQVDTSEIRTFLKRYGKTYFGESLRRKWLKVLAQKKHWKTFIQIYTPQKSTNLQCHYVYALLMTKRYKKKCY